MKKSPATSISRNSVPATVDSPQTSLWTVFTEMTFYQRNSPSVTVQILSQWRYNSSFAFLHTHLTVLKAYRASLAFSHPVLHNKHLCWSGGLYVYVVTLYSTLAPPGWHTEVRWSNTGHSGSNPGHLCRWHVFESLRFSQVRGPHPSHTTGRPAIQPKEKCHRWGFKQITPFTCGEHRASPWLGVRFWPGQRENCPESGSNAPESKVTPVSYSAGSLHWKRRQSTRCQDRQRKESPQHTPRD